MPLLPILEDNAERIAAMRSALSLHLPHLEAIISDDQPTLIVLLESHWSEVVAVSLDHDLFDRADGSTTITGMDVAKYLSRREPRFPILIHSSNVIDADKMQRRLTRTGWHVTRVHPFDDTAWIGNDWLPKLLAVITPTPPRRRVSR